MDRTFRRSPGRCHKLQVGEYVLAVGKSLCLNSTAFSASWRVGPEAMWHHQYEDFIQPTVQSILEIPVALVNTKETGRDQYGNLLPNRWLSRRGLRRSHQHGADRVRLTGSWRCAWVLSSIQDLNHDLAKSFGIKDAKGALVSDIRDESPAGQAGLKQGDIITTYQGVSVEDAVTLQRQVTKTAVGMRVTIRVIRDGREKDLTVTIGEQPEITKLAKAETGESDYAFAGVAVQDLDRDTAISGVKGKVQGVVVTAVEQDSGAEKAGVMWGDVIREINRQPVKSVRDFEKVSSRLKKGENVLILIDRQGNALFLSAKV